MSNEEAIDQIAAARALEQRTGRRTRWFVRFLVILGLAQWAYSIFIGVAPTWAIAASAGVWVVFVVGISLWANRQTAVPRFASQLMGVWGAGFAVLWGAVVATGTQVDPSQRLSWFTVGGLVVAAWSWLLAGWMHRRITRAIQ